MTEEEFTEWLFDTSRNSYRALLVVFEHSAGAVRLGSLPYMSSLYEAFDEWLIRAPELNESLDDFLSVGDVDAVNRDTSVDWMSLNFRGEYCRWYYGDITWGLAEFRPIATAVIAGCRNVTENRFRFDLLDGGQQLKRTFVNVSSTENRTVQDAIDWVMTEAALPAVTYVGVSATKLAYSVQFDVDDQSLAGDTVQLLAQSIGAHVRINQDGDTEVYDTDINDPDPVSVTEDSIAYSGVEMIEVLPAYRRLTIELANGSTVTAPTNSDTGQLNETKRIKTLLSSTAEATAILNELLPYYSVTHGVWRIPVYDKGHQIQAGTTVLISHYQISDTGIVSSIRRSPLSDFTNIEVRI